MLNLICDCVEKNNQMINDKVKICTNIWHESNAITTFSFVFTIKLLFMRKHMKNYVDT